MAFYDGLAKDPKNKDEFWHLIEETFDQVEATLTDFPVETREEALHSYANSGGEFVRYRGASKDYDCRDYFLTLGRTFLPRVKQQIKSRRLTPKFAKDWGVIMMCHGFTAAHTLDDSDGLSHRRAGHKTAKVRSKDAQRKWIAHQLLRGIDSGCTRGQAEGQVEKQIKKIIERGKFPEGFSKAWFESTLISDVLARTYDQRHLPLKQLRELAEQATDDIPPIDFFAP
jgi:hypothetical protein